VKPLMSAPGDTLDLSPAKSLWHPGDRMLPNTFGLFRRVLQLNAKPKKAAGWIIAESRYLIEVNGGRVQWGPATQGRLVRVAAPCRHADELQDFSKVRRKHPL
jgi:hypothetical protein